MNRTGGRTRIIEGLALALMALTVIGCASANKTAFRQASAASAWSFAAGDYGKAIEAYQRLYEKDRANGRVVSGYAAMIEDVKTAGDEARAKGSFTTAQGAYRVICDGWDGFSAIASRLTFKKSDLEAGIRDCRLALCERQFRQELGTGNHAKALAVYQAALKDYPGNAAAKDLYAKGVADIRAIGTRALEAKDYALAGKVSGLLLRNIDSIEAVAGRTAGGGSARRDLEETIRACSSRLTNGGLVEYRKGNIESAIMLWDELLGFDPGNTEIKKAVETAKAQLGKLKGSGRGGGRSGRSARGAR
ncbi:MAG: tetratricopeptide repeat protein [Candidatus Aminicenantes bacterium RBG_16_66_30]